MVAPSWYEAEIERLTQRLARVEDWRGRAEIAEARLKKAQIGLEKIRVYSFSAEREHATWSDVELIASATLVEVLDDVEIKIPGMPELIEALKKKGELAPATSFAAQAAEVDRAKTAGEIPRPCPHGYAEPCILCAASLAKPALERT